MKSFNKKICISSDHAGYKIKEYIKTLLDYAKKVAKRIKCKKSDFGILVCGSGTGMAISANKIRGVRAAVCYNKTSTYLCRSHNNANILCIGARLTKKNSIGKIVSMFLKTKFEGGRHQRRIRKI